MRRFTHLLAGAAVGSMAFAIPLVAANPALASSPGPNTMVAVQSGVSAQSLPGSPPPFGSTPSSTPETVSFVLRERNVQGLESEVEHGVSRYDSVSQFARQYGQDPGVIAGLSSYLGKYGIKTQADADNVDVVATGTAGDFDSALAVTQQEYHVNGIASRDGLAAIPAQTVHADKGSPKLPYHIARDVLAVLGLTNYGPFGSQAVHTDTSVTKPQAGSSNSCVALSGLPDACNLPSNFASDYGLTSLYNKGANGSGQTLAIVTLAALDPGAPQYFWQNVAKIASTGRTVTVDNVDGGPGAPSDSAGTGETDLDVEQSGGLAPGANVIVYQAPNTDSGFADAFFEAASQNIASSVSSSWGESETYLQASIAVGTESPAYQSAFDEAFLEMAIQGQSGFASSGDDAAYDATADQQTTNLAVDNPADSPYITAAGGTTLAWSGTLTGASTSVTVTVPSQRTWGWDYLWQPVATLTGESLTASAESQVVGSGGGFSATEPTPSYQRGVSGTQSFNAVQYLTPTTPTTTNGLTLPTAFSFNAAPSVTSGTGTGRAVPDASADADPYTGYLLYEPSATQSGNPVLQGGWGGTSFVAPQFNGSTAVIDSYLGHRVGLWNSSIYRFAQGYGSPFTPLQAEGTSSDNLYYTGNPGATYNPASGLGIPDFGKLALDYVYSSRR
jgi:kumamolisin